MSLAYAGEEAPRLLTVVAGSSTWRLLATVFGAHAVLWTEPKLVDTGRRERDSDRIDGNWLDSVGFFSLNRHDGHEMVTG